MTRGRGDFSARDQSHVAETEIVMGAAMAAGGLISQYLAQVYLLVRQMGDEAGHGIVLHFASATRGEGTSTLAREFALLAAAGEAHVVLVDAGNSELSAGVGLDRPKRAGIIDQIQQGAPPDEAVAGLSSTRLHEGVWCLQPSPSNQRYVPAAYEWLR